MTIYYTMTFMLLVAEMVTFCVIVSPMPYTMRKHLFHFLHTSPIIGKLAYALKISFISIAILFIDALQRMFRITAEADIAKSKGNTGDIRTETNLAARKFYAQRNTYLTGFCLFLSLILTRTFYICLELIHAEEEYAKLKQNTAAGSSSKIASGEQAKQIEQLKAQLAAAEAKGRDFDTLKKQSSQNAAEYDRLADSYNEKPGAVSDKKKD